MNQHKPVYWKVNEPKKFSTAVSNLPRQIKQRYLERIDNMVHSENPIDRSDKWERTRYGLVWMARLSDYYRFSYLPDHKNRVIHLIRIGGHKEVGTEK